MNASHKRYRKCLMDTILKDDSCSPEDLLDVLYRCYSEKNAIENERIRNDLTKLNTALSSLTLEESDAAFDLVCDLCMEHERCAFLEGICIGGRLLTALTK